MKDTRRKAWTPKFSFPSLSRINDSAKPTSQVYHSFTLNHQDREFPFQIPEKGTAHCKGLFYIFPSLYFPPFSFIIAKVENFCGQSFLVFLSLRPPPPPPSPLSAPTKLFFDAYHLLRGKKRHWIDFMGFGIKFTDASRTSNTMREGFFYLFIYFILRFLCGFEPQKYFGMLYSRSNSKQAVRLDSV